MFCIISMQNAYMTGAFSFFGQSTNMSLLYLTMHGFAFCVRVKLQVNFLQVIRSRSTKLKKKIIIEIIILLMKYKQETNAIFCMSTGILE